MEDTTIKGEYHQWFESLEELRRELPSMIKRTPSNVREVTPFITDDARRVHWLGGLTASEFYAALDTSWLAYAGKVDAAATDMQHVFESDPAESQQMMVRRRKRVQSDYGDDLSMSRVWGGELGTAWSRAVKKPRADRSQRYATIFIDLGSSASKSHEQGIWRSAAAKVMCDTLIRMGFSVEIWSGDSGRGLFRHDKYICHWTGVRIKEYDQPLNNDRLATMTSMAMLRTVGFEMMAGSPWPIDGTFGWPNNKGLVKPLRERAEMGERVFRIDNLFYREEALAYLERNIAQLRTAALAA